jgi:hypothetical protein
MGTSSKTWNSQCTACDQGSYSGSQDLQCKPCPLGSYSNQTSGSGCAECALGSYSDSTGASVCKLCPLQTTTTTMASISIQDCSACALGSENTASGCKACGVGRYGTSQGCVSCPGGRYSSSTGMTFCPQCSYGTWSDTIGASSPDTCKICPATVGVSCPEGSSCPVVHTGWYRNFEYGSDVVFKCSPDEACLEAGLGNTSCASGYSGKACSDCGMGWFRVGTRCQKCLPAVVRWILAFFAFVFIVFLCWRLANVQDRLPLSVKIAFQWIQMLGLYGQISDKWPQSLRTLFNISSFSNVEIQYLGFSCSGGISFWQMWVLKLFMPIGFFCLLVGSSYLRGRGDLTKRMSLFLVIKQRLSRMLFSMTLLATLIFSTLFQVFNCVQQLDGTYFLFSDPSVKCYDQVWKAYISLDAIFILAYVILLPGFGLYYVMKYRNNKDYEETLAPFVRSYRNGAEYWEFLRLFYKLIFVLLRDTISMDSSSRVLVLVAVLFAEIYIENRLHPFKDRHSAEISFRYD